MATLFSTRLKSPSSPSRQSGVVTLVISLCVLLLSTFVVFNVSKAILMEQKITNNDNRAKQAFEAAEAGMNVAMHYLEVGNGDANDDGNLDTLVFDDDVVPDGIGDSNTRAVGRGSVTVTVTGAIGSPSIVATGVSDDRSARRVISQVMTTNDPLPNRPQNPLIVRGNVDIGGSATIENMEGFSTIWSGDDVDPGPSNSVTTKVPDIGNTTNADPDYPPYPACIDTPLSCMPVETSDKLGVGPDVIENDSSLGDLTSDEFFRNFFGTSPTNYRASMATIIAVGDAVNDVADLATSEVIWVDGDATFDPITVGCSVPTPGVNGKCDMTNPKPSILIVDGDATIGQNFSMYGILFVRGTLHVTGSSKVYGAAIVEDSVDATGGINVYFTSLVLNLTSLAGAASSSAGSWKDF